MHSDFSSSAGFFGVCDASFLISVASELLFFFVEFLQLFLLFSSVWFCLFLCWRAGFGFPGFQVFPSDFSFYNLHYSTLKQRSVTQLPEAPLTWFKRSLRCPGWKKAITFHSIENAAKDGGTLSLLNALFWNLRNREKSFFKQTDLHNIEWHHFPYCKPVMLYLSETEHMGANQNFSVFPDVSSHCFRVLSGVVRATNHSQVCSSTDLIVSWDRATHGSKRRDFFLINCVSWLELK